MWNTNEAPKDGKPIVAIGRLIWEDEFSATVEPFCAAIFWEAKPHGVSGWHYWQGDSYGIHLSVARTTNDDVRIDYWLAYPEDKPAVVTGSAPAAAAPVKVFDGGLGRMVDVL